MASRHRRAWPVPDDEEAWYAAMEARHPFGQPIDCTVRITIDAVHVVPLSPTGDPWDGELPADASPDLGETLLSLGRSIVKDVPGGGVIVAIGDLIGDLARSPVAIDGRAPDCSLAITVGWLDREEGVDVREPTLIPPPPVVADDCSPRWDQPAAITLERPDGATIVAVGVMDVDRGSDPPMETIGAFMLPVADLVDHARSDPGNGEWALVLADWPGAMSDRVLVVEFTVQVG